MQSQMMRGPAIAGLWTARWEFLMARGPWGLDFEEGET